MATFYLIDGNRVCSFETSFTKPNHLELNKWRNSRPATRSVYALESNRNYYMMVPRGWTKKPVPEPKVITMAKLMESVIPTNWKEIQGEIQVNSLFQ